VNGSEDDDDQPLAVQSDDSKTDSAEVKSHSGAEPAMVAVAKKSTVKTTVTPKRVPSIEK
jgi:hypothetical protein